MRKFLKTGDSFVFLVKGNRTFFKHSVLPELCLLNKKKRIKNIKKCPGSSTLFILWPTSVLKLLIK